MKISSDELTSFLNAANKAGYANADAPKATSLRPASEDYHFEQGEFVYHDTYFGARDFIGEEIVYQANEPVWGANYYGYILDPNMPAKPLYDFLRFALMQEAAGILPIRGPREFSEDGSYYTNKVAGTLDRFSGEERILIDNKLVYRCWYHGGAIT